MTELERTIYIEKNILIDVIWHKLHELGGGDARDEYTKGWDAAIDASLNEVGALSVLDNQMIFAIKEEITNE